MIEFTEIGKSGEKADLVKNSGVGPHLHLTFSSNKLRLQEDSQVYEPCVLGPSMSVWEEIVLQSPMVQPAYLHLSSQCSLEQYTLGD